MPLNRRRSWEFEAVLNGVIAPIGPGLSGRPYARSLWVLGPDCEHGWDGDHHQATIAVWQFAYAPPGVESLVPRDGCRRIGLDAGDVAQLRHFARRTALYYPGGGAVAGAFADGVLGYLSWLVQRGMADQAKPAGRSRETNASQTVAQAVAWFRENLLASPKVSEAAEAVAVSESHLRRLFREVGLPTPKRVLDALRIEEAEHLLRTTELKLAVVADRLGYSGPEAFSRAFRTARGVPPSVVRVAGR
ncbi:MAG: AraC family transcriptional regulator [Planctomycetota bacterium]